MSALQAGRTVQLHDGQPSPECRNLGPVTGKGGGAGGSWVRNERLIEFALNDARNKAAAKGATHISMNNSNMGENGGTTTSAMVIATAYRCPSVRAQTSGGETPAVQARAATPALEGAIAREVATVLDAASPELLACGEYERVSVRVSFEEGFLTKIQTPPQLPYSESECLKRIVRSLPLNQWPAAAGQFTHDVTAAASVDEPAPANIDAPASDEAPASQPEG